MKRQVILIAMLFFAFGAQAQHDSTLFQQIEKAGQSLNSMECNITNTYIKPDFERTKLGKLYYQADDKIGAHFDNGNFAIINGNKIKIDVGIFHGTFRTDRGKLIKPLAQMLSCAIHGQCLKLAEEYNYDLALEKKDNAYVATFTTRKRKLLGIGYRQAIFNYDLDDKCLKSVILIDYKGCIDTYQLENRRFDVKIDQDKFKI